MSENEKKKNHTKSGLLKIGEAALILVGILLTIPFGSKNTPNMKS